MPNNEGILHLIRGVISILREAVEEKLQDPALLQTDAMAANLNFAKGRLPGLFRRQMGMSIKEISNEFGFTDMSHLNKFFRKLKGVSPRNYRKTLRS